MATVTICHDVGAQEKEICHYFHIFGFCFPCSNGAIYHDLRLFFSIHVKLALSLFFTLIKRLFRFSSLSAIRVVSSTYLRLLMFLPPILIPACNSSSSAFLMICSAYRLDRVTADSPDVLFSQYLFHTVF